MLRSLAHHPSYRRGREGGKEHDKSNEQELTDPKKKKKIPIPKAYCGNIRGYQTKI